MPIHIRKADDSKAAPHDGSVDMFVNFLIHSRKVRFSSFSIYKLSHKQTYKIPLTYYSEHVLNVYVI